MGDGLRIAIDAHMVGTRETGNETYTLNLIRGLQRVDTVNHYRLLTDDAARLRRYVDEGERCRVVETRPAANPLRIPFAIPAAAWRERVDVLHVTYNAPPLSPCPVVVTVHDISFALFPDHFSPRDRLVLSSLVPLSMRRAAHVLTLTQTGRRDLLSRYRLPPERVTAIPLAAGPLFRRLDHTAELDAALTRYGIDGPFALAVGNLQPRKNLPRLVEAFAQVRAAGETGVRLVIVGQARWQASGVHEAVRRYGLEDAVVFTGYLPDDDLVRLYNAARVFIYPSLYEGFGLPPLEAMACGAPVVASNVGAVAEVCADAARLVPPTDVRAIAEAVLSVLRDEGVRGTLRERGFRRAAEFAWDETARRTLAVYRQVARRQG